MSDNLGEIIFYHSLEHDEVVTPQGMLEALGKAKEPIEAGRISDYYKKDLKPLQPYGGVGEEDIPLRYRNFIGRIASEIRSVAGYPLGFEGVLYTFSGVDLSTILPLVKDGGVVITIDRQDPFWRGYRPHPEEVEKLDKHEMQRDAFEKATHGMHSVEMGRGGWGLSAELQLAGIDPERGDKFTVIEDTVGPDLKRSDFVGNRRRTKSQLVVGGKSVTWIHYQMYLTEEGLSEGEPYKDEIWEQLRKDLQVIFEGGGGLVLSKAGMGVEVSTSAVARSGLVKSGNFVCRDISDDLEEEFPGLHLHRLSLDNLKDISPQFGEEYIQTHKMVQPFINFGYQKIPKKIFLAKVVD